MHKSREREYLINTLYNRQHGAAALIFVLLLITVGLGVFVGVANNHTILVKQAHDRMSVKARAEAKDALLGFAISNPTRGFLPCPADPALAGTATEGTAMTSCNSDALRIGRLPWRTLGIDDLHDGYGEALWYAVDGNFTADAATINRASSVGTLTVNGSGNIAAIIFSVGSPIGGQLRGNNVSACATTGAALRQDYCATNYLDVDPGGISNADANTAFTQSRTDTFNDTLLMISANQFFEGVEKRVLQQVRTCLRTYASDPGNPTGLYPWAHAVSGTGYSSTSFYSDNTTVITGRIPDQVVNSVMVGSVPIAWSANCPLPCPTIAPGVSCATSKNWLMDWHELIFYAVSPQYTPSGPGGGIAGSLTVNGTPYVRAVAMLAGASLTGQSRVSLTDKDVLNNYLEGNNAVVGTSVFGNSLPPYNDRALIVAP